MVNTDLGIQTPSYVDFAVEAHGDQKYGDMPYYWHLYKVAQVLEDFEYTQYKWRASAWLHDSLEDTETTVHDLIKNFGSEVAEIVIACTGEGSNRAERVSNILHKLQHCPEACIVKLADRIANVEAGGKVEMYRKENDAFVEVIKSHVPEKMLQRLEKAFNVSETINTTE
jgi:(p)ppGpp synthase/HD superfamily hydrolase